MAADRRWNALVHRIADWVADSAPELLEPRPEPIVHRGQRVEIHSGCTGSVHVQRVDVVGASLPGFGFCGLTRAKRSPRKVTGPPGARIRICP
jgi:hypothetical protein